MCVLSIHSYVVVSEMETFFKYWQTTVFLIFMLKSTVKPEKKKIGYITNTFLNTTQKESTTL